MYIVRLPIEGKSFPANTTSAFFSPNTIYSILLYKHHGDTLLIMPSLTDFLYFLSVVVEVRSSQYIIS